MVLGLGLGVGLVGSMGALCTAVARLSVSSMPEMASVRLKGTRMGFSGEKLPST